MKTRWRCLGAGFDDSLMLPCAIRPSVLEQLLSIRVRRHMSSSAEREEDAAHGRAGVRSGEMVLATARLTLLDALVGAARRLGF